MRAKKNVYSIIAGVIEILLGVGWVFMKLVEYTLANAISGGDITASSVFKLIISLAVPLSVLTGGMLNVSPLNLKTKGSDYISVIKWNSIIDRLLWIYPTICYFCGWTDEWLGIGFYQVLILYVAGCFEDMAYKLMEIEAGRRKNTNKSQNSMENKKVAQSGLTVNKSVSSSENSVSVSSIHDGSQHLAHDEFIDPIDDIEALVKIPEDAESIEIPEQISIMKGFYNYPACHELKAIIISPKLKKVFDEVFSECSVLDRVYYKGTQKDWNNTQWGYGNSNLTNATRYYYSEDEPVSEGNYWHYVDGEIVEW